MIVLSKKHRELSLGKSYNNYIIIRKSVTKNLSKHKLLKNYYINGEVVKISFISNPIKRQRVEGKYSLVSEVFKNVNWELNVVGWTNSDFKRFIIMVLIVKDNFSWIFRKKI